MNRFANLRTMVDRFLVDTCTIRDLGAAPIFDRETLAETFTPGDVVYTGRCRIRPESAASMAEIGGGPVYTGRYQLTLPFTALGLKIDQTVTIDTSDDPALEGATFRIVDTLAGSDASHRRVICEHTTDAAEWAEVGS